MSKKKLSKKGTVNKQAVNKSKKINATQKRSLIIVALSYLGLKLVDKVFDTILEQPAKDILSMVVDWIRSI